MQTARSVYAILAAIVSIVGLFIRPFDYHRELPSSAQTREAVWALQANPTPENQAIWLERVKADVANNDRRKNLNYLLTYFTIVAAMWGLWWFTGKLSSRNPDSK